ncbi:hypothetical protein K505DRAFT_322307 [Melanomma pulvis-pyrius CBS 109.77]|uniref:Uncharacterized protein n=1 Tax=Melanomma pulvis-pyrius CBS 109.77 TaxID=1314802 RepID=A0A6A6XNH0_9PLEO|nr:hypothetical protein K505DRAFT_322307 [Melanomma pulvis-pyrius CBS 109.77]
MIFAFWLAAMIASSTAVAIPLPHPNSFTEGVHDADEMIGNVWALSTSKHGEDLGPVQQKREEVHDADEMIGNVCALSTAKHGEDLGPVSME